MDEEAYSVLTFMSKNIFLLTILFKFCILWGE